MLLTNTLWTLLLTFTLLLHNLKIIFMIFSPININSFLNPTDETIVQIIMSLIPSKAIGPNSIPTKILMLLINGVSSQLNELFNLSFFLTFVFPFKLKTSNVISAYKKDSKLNCSDYRPISLLSNIDKVLERLM